MKLVEYLEAAVDAGAADVFLVAGAAPSMKMAGTIMLIAEEKLTPADAEVLLKEAYQYAGRSMDKYMQTFDDDFSFAIKGLARFRINAYRQRGSMACVIRVVSFEIPDYRKLGIPGRIIKLSDQTRGLILVTGPTGSGKSTTLACMVDHINKTRGAHIISLEDPIEFLHRNNKSLISQREILIDTANYVTALRACLRQAPDVIQLGELRDYDTIRTAMTAAETGHLVFSTLHTIGAVNTIDRIIDVFPPDQQYQIRTQLSMVLSAVVSQQLLPTVDGGRVPAYEIMLITPAIKNMIREGKTYQIDNVVATSSVQGMLTMDSSILKLYNDGLISAATAENFAVNGEAMRKKMGIV